jgi:hypothetical protein
MLMFNNSFIIVKGSSIGCRGNLSTTLQNENLVPGQPHNHAPSDTSIKYSKTRKSMKDLATNCCVLLRQSDIFIGGWDWRSWTRVSNCAVGVFFTGQQGLDIVVTLGHNLGLVNSEQTVWFVTLFV